MAVILSKSMKATLAQNIDNWQADLSFEDFGKIFTTLDSEDFKNINPLYLAHLILSDDGMNLHNGVINVQAAMFKDLFINKNSAGYIRRLLYILLTHKSLIVDSKFITIFNSIIGTIDTSYEYHILSLIPHVMIKSAHQFVYLKQLFLKGVAPFKNYEGGVHSLITLLESHGYHIFAESLYFIAQILEDSEFEVDKDYRIEISKWIDSHKAAAFSIKDFNSKEKAAEIEDLRAIIKDKDTEIERLSVILEENNRQINILKDRQVKLSDELAENKKSPSLEDAIKFITDEIRELSVEERNDAAVKVINAVLNSGENSNANN